MQPACHRIFISVCHNPRLRRLFLLSLSALVCHAQVDSSSLTGTVRDATGGVIESAHIRAELLATGLVRETVSNAAGAWALPNLPVGDYTVTVAKAGFATLRISNVGQTVGSTRTLNPTLSIAGKGEQITVSETVADLDRNGASLGGRIERKQVAELPMNGRNWYSLSALVPGAIDSGGSNMKSIRFAGRGLDDNNFTLDGVDATGIINQAQRGQGRMTIPTEAIGEFRAEAALYSGELGGSSGGQISVTSPSGTNDPHGSLYEYFRNDVLNARSPFDGATPPPFRLNQYGASLSGPVRRNQTFFFGAWEGYNQRLGQTLTGFVPLDSFRATVVPALATVVSAFPKANGPALDARTASYTFQGLQKVDENTGLFRLDHRFRDSLTGFIRYSQDEAVSNVPSGSIGQTQAVVTLPKNGAATLLQVVSPTVTNEYKFGFNQEITHTKTQSPLAYTVAVSGLSSVNAGSTKDERGTTLSWLDNLNWIHGRHLIKAGAEVRYVEMDQGNSFTGTLTYSSLANFAANLLDKATETALLPMKHQRKTQVFSFLQDEYKLRSNLTLNLGLRYEFYNVLHETQNRALPFDFNTCGPGGYCPAGSDFTFPNKLDLDPRLSLAWAPDALGGNTVVRLGAGIYHGDGQLDDQNLPIANDVQRYSLTRVGIPALAYPVDPFIAQASGVVTPRLLDRHRKDEYVSEWGLSVQQKLGHSFAGTLSYAGSKGTNLLTTSYVNGINPATGTRPYPAFGIVEYRGNNSNSTFESMQLSLQRRFQRGLLFSANYLLAHSINDGATGGGEAVFPQNINCRACEKASSDQDVRQVFNANAVYLLPFTAGPGVAHRLFGDWQFSGIATARTGLPVNVTADRASGDLPDGYATNQRPNVSGGLFTVPAPGKWGNAGRNLLRAKGVWQLDASLSRSISLTERLRLQFRAEGFNLLNRAQYGPPLADISVPATYGRITTLVNNGPTGTGTPRQFQLALRLGF